jgi:hypothetical protein
MCQGLHGALALALVSLALPAAAGARTTQPLPASRLRPPGC